MAQTQREYDLEYEIKRRDREIAFLAALVEALKAGGGEIDKDNAVGPNTAPYDGKPVRLWNAPWGWLPDVVTFDCATGMFVQKTEKFTSVNSGDQNCDLWKPANI